MKKLINRLFTGDRDGSVLMTVLLLIGVLLLAGMSMSFMTGSSAIRTRHLERTIRAQAIAEAGVADMIMKLTTNWNGWAVNKKVTTNFAGGTYTVWTKADTNTGNILITSTGVIDNVSRATVLELLGDIYTLYDSVFGVNGVIVAGGDVTLEHPAVINGGISSNGNIINGGNRNPEVNGDIQAVGGVGITPTGTFVGTPNADPIAVPNYIPTMPDWYDMATNNGLYINSSFTFTGETFAPPNGVMYVNGNVTVLNRSTLYGILVAAGSVLIRNNFHQYQIPGHEDWPAIIAEIDFSDDNLNVYTGAIFAGNNISSSNNRIFNGPLIALNEVFIQNSGEVNWTSPPAWSPDDTNNAPPPIIFGGWLQ